MWNRHRMFITHIGIQKHKKLYKIGSGTKLYYFFEFKGFSTSGEREAQSFYADFSICPKPRTAPAENYWPGLGEQANVNLLLPTLKLNSLTFLKSPKSSVHASGAWRHSHLLASFSIWDFYFDISKWHILPARACTPALMLHLTNPCAKRKVLSLTKKKGKIYKTKSLGHYITLLCVCLCVCV